MLNPWPFAVDVMRVASTRPEQTPLGRANDARDISVERECVDTVRHSPPFAFEKAFAKHCLVHPVVEATDHCVA